MIYYTEIEKVKEYYDHPALNQSKLKKLLKGVDYYNSKDEDDTFKEKESFIIGSAVDALITTKRDDFFKLFYVSDLSSKPSDTIMEIMKELFLVYDPLRLLEDMKGDILDICNEKEYYKTWKDDTRVNKILDHKEYWLSLIKSQGKTVLSKEEYDLADKIRYYLITTHKNTYSNFTDFNKVVYYQFPLYFKYKGIECKALPDMVVVYLDEVGKPESVEIIDLKTTGFSTIEFPKSLRKFRYDIQAAFYIEALKSNLDKFSLSSDVKIKPFKFVVESTKTPGTPITYICNEDIINVGKRGKTPKIVEGVVIDYPMKGFDNLISDYVYYQEQGWVQDKRLDKNNGVLEINWDGIIY